MDNNSSYTYVAVNQDNLGEKLTGEGGGGGIMHALNNVGQFGQFGGGG